jgi:hypothetical protein
MFNFIKEYKYFFLFFAAAIIILFLFQVPICSNLLYLRFLLNSQRTPEEAALIELPSKLDREKIKIPVTAFRVISPFKIKTKRSRDNILNTIEKASLILNQIDVEIEPVEVRDISLKGLDYKDWFLLDAIIESTPDIPGYNENNLNLFFIKRNPGTGIQVFSGIADPDTNISLLIDRADYPDFRILAHEIGHLLGLEHPDLEDPKRSLYLMGKGLLFTEEECRTAYEEGLKLLENQ